MSDFFYWFGLVHFFAYAAASFLAVSVIFADWVLRKLNIHRAIVLGYFRHMQDRRKDIPG